MPAFGYARAGNLEGTIRTLFDRMLSHYTPCELTMDEVVAQFYPDHLKEAAYTLADAFNLGYGRISHFSTKIEASGVPMNITLQWSGANPIAPLVPKTIKPFNPDTPTGQKILSWVTSRVEVGKQFGIARAVFRELNEVCGSEQQLRFFFPSVLILADQLGAHHEEYKTLADKLRPSKTPRILPPIPQWVREGIPIATTAITAASLMPDAAKHPRTEVNMMTSSVSGMIFHGHEIDLL